MNGKLSRVAAALAFTSAAITFSLTVWAAPGDIQPNGNAILGQCIGVPGAQIVSPFADHYSCVSLGSAPGARTPFGGLILKFDDPNTLRIGVDANSSPGRIYQIGVTRGAN